MLGAQLPEVDYRWVEKKNKGGIKIFTSVVPGSKYKAVRGEMQVAASVASLVALVEDLPNCSNWIELCQQSTVIKRLSASRSHVYVINDLPFPVQDRDVFVDMQWRKDPATGRVSLIGQAIQGGPSNDSAVRVTEAQSQWHFTPLADGTTKVESFAHANPNGNIPAWIANMLVVRAPYRTLRNMRVELSSERYADSQPALLEQL